jgi:nitrogen-specific signal transduction histidine kinase
MKGGKAPLSEERALGTFASVTRAPIPVEVAADLDPFFTTKPEGTGLGLSIASQNIRGLGGRLELESDGQFKTLFKLTLPLHSREEAVARQN